MKKKINTLRIKESAPTKFAYKKSKGEEPTTHGEHTIAPLRCKHATSARNSKKQQHSVVLLRVMLMLWLYHRYDRGYVIRIMCETPHTYPIFTET